MYRLEVFHPGASKPTHSEHVLRASEALARIPALLQTHDGCDKVVVYIDNARLFAVDCKGNRIEG